ncbi:lamin-B3-like [Heptranchias perlo]|uniref:lamin-B3-like n=1 Tax=Heptranchias perlo TaxID=212740 RepID=UPI00355A1BE3
MALRTSTPARRQGSAKSGLSIQKQSPTRLSRLQEKEELQQLNDRLAAYIERIRWLESENQALLQRVTECQEADSSEFRTIRSAYDTELADARKALDKTANERARLQVELGRVCEEHRQLKERNAKKESDLNSALAKLRDLETSLNSKEAMLATCLSEKRNLENELSDVKVQLAKINSVANDAKKQLQDEMLQRCDLTNRAQTLQEQLDFAKNLYAKEIKETKRKYEIMDIESGHQQEYNSKLAKALQQLREDQCEQIQRYKEELERSFNAKLENAELSAAKNSDFASAAKEEVTAAKMRTETLSSQLHQCRNQISALQTKTQDLEMMLDREREVSHQRMVEKDREIAEIREQIQTKLEEYDGLLDVKLALDQEINFYRKMLEGEEHRGVRLLELTPIPPSHSVGRTSSRGTSFRGKKRKLSEAKIASFNYEASEHVSSVGKIILEEFNNEGKYVKLKNASNKDQPLNGWIIRRQFADLTEITYKFPARFILKAMEAVIVWAASTDVVQSPIVDLVWKSQTSWGVADHVKVVLLNAGGEEMATRTVKQVRGILESESKEEDCEDTSGDRSLIEFLPMSHAENEDSSCTIM